MRLLVYGLSFAGDTAQRIHIGMLPFSGWFEKWEACDQVTMVGRA